MIDNCNSAVEVAEPLLIPQETEYQFDHLSAVCCNHNLGTK